MLSAFIFLLVLMPMLAFALQAGAQGFDETQFGLDYAENIGLATTEEDPRDVAVGIIKFLLTFLGIVAVAVILYGGFIWLTAGGNDDRVSKAKKLIIAGIIGLIIVIAAFAIVTFIINLTYNAIEGDLGI